MLAVIHPIAMRRLLAIFIGVTLWLGAEPARSADAVDLAQAGIVAKERRQYPLAIKLIDAALRQGTFTNEQKAILIYNRGVAYDVMGLSDRALNDFDATIALVPTFPSPYVYRAIIMAAQGRYEAALSDLNRASQLAPDDPLILNNIGAAHEKFGEHEKALQSYGRAIVLRPDYAEAYYNRAAVYVALGDFDRAVADYDAAIRLLPAFPSAYANRGILNLRRGAAEQAIDDLGQAIELSPMDPMLRTNRANALLTMARYQEATADFDRALTIDPGNIGAYFGRGQARLYMAENEKSAEDFATAVRLRPDNPYVVICCISLDCIADSMTETNSRETHPTWAEDGGLRHFLIFISANWMPARFAIRRLKARPPKKRRGNAKRSFIWQILSSTAERLLLGATC